MRLFLCGQGQPAKEILTQIVDGLHGINEVAVYSSSQEIRTIADDAGLWSTSEPVNKRSIWPFEPDAIASLYYRHIIRKHIVQAMPGKIFNAHASLLPRHRGRSPIPWAIIQGDQYTGVTYHYIDNGIDTGNIIFQAVCQIDQENETQTSLFHKVNRLVVEHFPAALELVKSGFPGVYQTGQSNYNKAGVPYNRQISPLWTLEQIDRFIRAMIYLDLPPAEFNGREIRTMHEYHEAKRELKQTNNRHRITVSG